jgi:hypothetical protein
MRTPGHAAAGGDHLHRIIAYSAAVAWLILGTYTVRRLANQLARAIALADKATAVSVRLLLTIAGIVVVLLITLTTLRIGVSQLLLGGAITGVVLGIAAQQSLGNMFAGIVLLVARPFRAGDHVRVRSGALGGPLEGHVVSMGLTYVVFTTEDGTTLVPNLTLLAAGIVRAPLPAPGAPSVVVAGGAVTPVEAGVAGSVVEAGGAVASGRPATGSGLAGTLGATAETVRPVAPSAGTCDT